MESNLTAVDFIEDYLKFKGLIINDKTIPQVLVGVINDAKEMEKQQIIDAYGVKVNHSIEQGTTVYTRTFGEQYYNETFKK
jgi:hypothetical protein